MPNAVTQAWTTQEAADIQSFVHSKIGNPAEKACLVCGNGNLFLNSISMAGPRHNCVVSLVEVLTIATYECNNCGYLYNFNAETTGVM